ncbi:unnamed protein product [Hermetia illucens]|uniref:Uncharacterized protein n=1 Tax=Hermetia illucens TaxID=343691 RepID=A0A7R8UJB1_HERIL|nr:unnamed protein product [Hermetia illucens]
MLAFKLILYLALSREIGHSAHFGFRAVITKLLDINDFHTVAYLIPDRTELDQSDIFPDLPVSVQPVPVLIVSRPLSVNISHIINDNIFSIVFMNNRTKDRVLSLLSSVLYKSQHSNYQSRILLVATE